MPQLTKIMQTGNCFFKIVSFSIYHAFIVYISYIGIFCFFFFSIRQNHFQCYLSSFWETDEETLTKMPGKSLNSNHILPIQHSLWSHSATASSDFCKLFYILLNGCQVSPQGITAFYWMLNSLLISVGCVNAYTPFCPSLSSHANSPNLILGAL